MKTSLIFLQPESLKYSTVFFNFIDFDTQFCSLEFSRDSYDFVIELLLPISTCNAYYYILYVKSVFTEWVSTTGWFPLRKSTMKYKL